MRAGISVLLLAILSGCATPPAVRFAVLTVTAYCPCERCCPGTADGYTSTMSDAYSRGIAARNLPPGTVCFIPGYGTARVDDKFGGAGLDVRFPEHATALVWGRQILRVALLED